MADSWLISRALALALLDGEWSAEPMVEQGAGALVGARRRWLRPLAKRIMDAFPDPPGDSTLADFIADDEGFRANTRYRHAVRVRRWCSPPPAMEPSGFEAPAIATTGELAARLGVTVSELDWFADARSLHRHRVDAKLRHYVYRWVTKRSAGYRLLETPKRRIKAMQRALLRDVLAQIPPSPHAHGFVPGRSVHSFVAPHVGRRIVVRLDLEDFFATIGPTWVTAIFARVGYPQPVARTLAGLCTTATPGDVLEGHPRTGVDLSRRFATISRLRAGHLPQGAPTSPALSNLAAHGLDRRLDALARAVDASYTRYADDLVLSGGDRLHRSVDRVIHTVGAIALEEGFSINFRKTRVMRSGRRQRVAGLVINERANVARREYDALRATLYNAIRFGPASQNREGRPDFRAHLEGRIAWIASTSATRGQRLARLFDRVEW